MGLLILPYLLPNFKIESYYRSKPEFKSAFSPNDLTNMFKDGVHTVNLDVYKSIGTHSVTFVQMVKIQHTLIGFQLNAFPKN